MTTPIHLNCICMPTSNLTKKAQSWLFIVVSAPVNASQLGAKNTGTKLEVKRLFLFCWCRIRFKTTGIRASFWLHEEQWDVFFLCHTTHMVQVMALLKTSQSGFKTFPMIIIIMFFFISFLPLFYCWYKFQHRILSQSRSAAPLSVSLPPTLFFPHWRRFLCNPLSTAVLHIERERQKRIATRLPSFWFYLLPLQAHFLLFLFLWSVPFLCHSLTVWRFLIWLCNCVLCPWAINHRLYTLFQR